MILEIRSRGGNMMILRTVLVFGCSAVFGFVAGWAFGKIDNKKPRPKLTEEEKIINDALKKVFDKYKRRWK